MGTLLLFNKLVFAAHTLCLTAWMCTMSTKYAYEPNYMDRLFYRIHHLPAPNSARLDTEILTLLNPHKTNQTSDIISLPIFKHTYALVRPITRPNMSTKYQKPSVRANLWCCCVRTRTHAHWVDRQQQRTRMHKCDYIMHMHTFEFILGVSLRTHTHARWFYQRIIMQLKMHTSPRADTTSSGP